MIPTAIRSVLEGCLTELAPLPCIRIYAKVLYHLYAQDTLARDFIEHFRYSMSLIILRILGNTE